MLSSIINISEVKGISQLDLQVEMTYSDTEKELQSWDLGFFNIVEVKIGKYERRNEVEQLISG